MNTRQGILVTLFSATLFMNFAANIWTMWSVATFSFFMLMITDFMFFEVRSRSAEPILTMPRTRSARNPRFSWRRPHPRAPCTVAAHRSLSFRPSQDTEFWP